MAVNYVKGQILSGVLERDGIDLSIANANVGINKSSPSTTLDVNGNVLANNLFSNQTVSAVGNVYGDNVLANNLFSNQTVSAVGNVYGGNLIIGNNLIPTTGNIIVGNVNINNVTNPVQDQDAATKFYVDHTISNIGNIGNLTVSNTTISTNLANGNITLTPTGTGLVTINTTTGLVLPVGNTSQQPSSTPAGTVRYNTTTSLPEFYNGSYWSAFNAGVTNQTLNGDGSTVAFTLQTATTTAAVLIMLNGITQVPDQAYSMSPSPSTNLVFSEAPGTGDVIDIRFL
jgi:hypothetical protein